MIEYTVPTDHPYVGWTVETIDWPAETTLVAILRDGVPITPSNDDVVEGDDELFLITTPTGERELRSLFNAEVDSSESSFERVDEPGTDELSQGQEM